MNAELRGRFQHLLIHADAPALLAAFAQPWFNEIVPGAEQMIGCGQGTTKHLEGDVAEHTALVFENLLKVAVRRLGREADFVERLAVVLHDLRKPAVRVDRGGGDIAFPGHEALAAKDVSVIGEYLGLSISAIERLHFLVARHGDAHSWEEIGEEGRMELRASPFAESLALLQEADALSCLFPDGSHLPIYWNEICSESLRQ